VTKMSGRYDKLERILTVVGIISSLVISAISLNYSVLAFNLANNYQPSVEIRKSSPLVLAESCVEGPPATRSCSLAGTFNVSFSIISPHPGTYNITLVSFVPTFLPRVDLSFLGKNLTLVSFTIENGTYLIKARNETSGHFAYFISIGGDLPPAAWVVEKQFETEGPNVANAPANGFENTAVIAVNGKITRFGGNDSSEQFRHLGALTVLLTYHDVPLDRDIQRLFTVEVLLSQNT